MDPPTCIFSRSYAAENIFETAAAFIHTFLTKLLTLPECNTCKPYAAAARAHTARIAHYLASGNEWQSIRARNP
jgi:hypothetical protein